MTGTFQSHPQREFLKICPSLKKKIFRKNVEQQQLLLNVVVSVVVVVVTVVAVSAAKCFTFQHLLGARHQARLGGVRPQLEPWPEIGLTFGQMRRSSGRKILLRLFFRSKTLSEVSKSTVLSSFNISLKIFLCQIFLFGKNLNRICCQVCCCCC